MVNKVILVGEISSDPVLQNTDQGVPYVRFGMTTKRTYQQNDEYKTEVNTHAILAYGKTAEIICEHCGRGKPVYIEGHLKRRFGSNKEIDEVIAARMSFVDDPNYQPKKQTQQTYNAKDFCADDIPF